MIALIQRVSEASVMVSEKCVASIHAGLLAFVCAERNDTEQDADKLLDKLLAYRVFADDNDKMNRSLIDLRGDLLVVSQFTLAADTFSGTRPSFTPAAPPAQGLLLYEYFVARAREKHLGTVQTGEFGAAMRVSLINDGPVTFWLRSRKN
jgi:D-aminoacyl-tRNA deacylase